MNKGPFKFFVIVFLSVFFSPILKAFPPGDSAQVTVAAYALSNSEIKSLMDKSVNVILNAEMSQGDIQSYVSLDASHLLVDGRGFDYVTLNTWANAGASIIVDHSFSTFDIKSLTGSGGNKVYVFARGMDIFDLEAFITNGANIIFDRSTSYSYLYSAIKKYGGRIYLDTKGFSLLELKDMMTYGAGVFITGAIYTGDIRNLIKQANRYGGNVIINQRLSYFDIKFMLE